MGNRGCLHDAAGQIRKVFARKAWVTCRLEWKGIRRNLFSPGRYTELFFLDEATALAAGHRPCNDCRSEAYSAFKDAWQATQAGGGFVKAEAMDNQIHAERFNAGKGKRTFNAPIGDLPDGVIVVLPGSQQESLLLWRGKLWEWTFEGYRAPREAFSTSTVDVLTPASLCAVLSRGYPIEVHSSARGIPIAL
jgi:hypothetical protein